MNNTNFVNRPIDAVITWVDGKDADHKAKRLKYGNDRIFRTEDVAGDTRYTSVGEIFYCIASLNRFAPWLNRIYIVTDGQNPQADTFIRKHFPEKHIPIEIVDHRTIFKGYEEFLPTFSSISIETMTWRIPGLSERYIELNDDFILAAPTTPEDFFTRDGKVICYGRKYSSLLVRFTRLLKYRKDGSKKVTFKETMLNAASLLGNSMFFIKIYHTPRALLKSVYQDFFDEHPEHLIRNISYKFRNHRQYNPQEVQLMLLYRKKRCILRNAKRELLYLKPKHGIEYVNRKLKRFTELTEYKFACFNSIDQACSETQRAIISWIERRLGLHV